MVKHLPVMWETQDWPLGREDPLEKEMAPHSSTLAWKIPWMEEPGRLQSMGLQRVRHNWATSLSFKIISHFALHLVPLLLPLTLPWYLFRYSWYLSFDLWLRESITFFFSITFKIIVLPNWRYTVSELHVCGCPLFYVSKDCGPIIWK